MSGKLPKSCDETSNNADKIDLNGNPTNNSDSRPISLDTKVQDLVQRFQGMAIEHEQSKDGLENQADQGNRKTEEQGSASSVNTEGAATDVNFVSPTLDLSGLEPENLELIRDEIINSIKKHIGNEFPDGFKEKWDESIKNILCKSSKEISKESDNANQTDEEKCADERLQACKLELDKSFDFEKLEKFSDDVLSSLKTKLGLEFEGTGEEDWKDTYKNLVDVFKVKMSDEDFNSSWDVEKLKSIKDEVFNAIQDQLRIELPESVKEKWESVYMSMAHSLMDCKPKTEN